MRRPYGRPRDHSPLGAALGVRLDGTVSEVCARHATDDHHSLTAITGRWAESTSRRPEFEDRCRSRCSGQGPGSLRERQAGHRDEPVRQGSALTIGYPFGAELVECERTSIGFQRTYVWFVREPQLVARVAWLRRLLVDELRLPARLRGRVSRGRSLQGKRSGGPGTAYAQGTFQRSGTPVLLRAPWAIRDRSTKSRSNASRPTWLFASSLAAARD